jgi:acetyltransferase-like isoleucine patch superfamily enzyme
LKNSSDLLGKLFWKLFIIRKKFRIIFLNFLIHLICYIRGVTVKKNVVFDGWPLIRRSPNSRIIIAENCIINSAKRSVEINLYKPCAFVTLDEGSEIVIGNNSGASGVLFVASKSIHIGNNVLIGAHSTIVDTDFHHSNPKFRFVPKLRPAQPVVIEDNVFIGFNCSILKGVTIGENSVIGANSVVMNNIPKNSIAIGNPCKVIILKKWD